MDQQNYQTAAKLHIAMAISNLQIIGPFTVREMVELTKIPESTVRRVFRGWVEKGVLDVEKGVMNELPTNGRPCDRYRVNFLVETDEAE